MLELRPTCEHCNAPLAASSTQARICSFECTFCAPCAEDVLGGLCPNCGGNLVTRPIRPAHDRKGGNFLGAYPASTKVKHRPADLEAHATLVARLRDIPPEHR